MKPYQLSDVYAAIKKLVKTWPIEENKPNTFAVLTSFSDLDSPSLGKTIRDKDRPYFYSKAWADQMYNPSRIRWAVPGVFLFEEEGSIDTSAANYITHTIQVAVLDSTDDQNEQYIKLATEERATHQILEDTENTLIELLTSIRNLELDVTDSSKWSRIHQALFLKENESFTFNPWMGGASELMGKVATIQITLPCAYNLKTFGIDSTEEVIQDHHKSQDMPEVEEVVLQGFDGDGLDTFDGTPMTEF